MARPKKIKELNENVIGNPKEVVVPNTEINGELESTKEIFTDVIITVRRYYDENRGFYNFIFEDSMGICLFFIETTDSDFNTWKSAFLKDRETEKTEYKFKLIIEK